MKNKKSIKKVIRNIIIGIVVTIIIILLNSGGILTYIIVNKRADFNELAKSEDYGINSAKITLTTSDNLNIESYLVETDNPKAYIIILSGIYSPSVTSFFGYAKIFKDLNYSSLLVEMRAHGNSDGNKIMLGYTEENDVNAAVEYINSIDNKIPIILFGTSMGGSVAINATSKYKRIDGVISQSAFSSWEENIRDQFESYGVPSFLTISQVPFTRFLLGVKYGFKNIGNTPINNIGKIPNEKILLLHSLEDSQVKFKSFDRLLNETDTKIETYIVPGDNHFILETDDEFSNPFLNRAYYDKIKLFIEKIIEGKEADNI